MAEDVEGVQEKPPNACCAALKKKHTKLLEKFAKLEEIKNRFRDCTALVQQKYDVIEKENENLKKALEELKVQANVWRDEKENESIIRTELEDEVSALKEEVQLLKQTGDSSSQVANQQLKGRLSVAEQEIKQLTELLDKERERASAVKKNAELEKEKANEVLKKVEIEKDKASEVQELVNANRHLQECLNAAEKENKHLIELRDEERGRADLEKKKANEALKKVELDKNKESEVQKMARANQQLQERLSAAEKEIKQLTELLDKEREIASVENKNAELDKKKANEALRKVEMEKNKASEAQKVANANQQLQERLNVAQKEVKQLTELLDKERERAALEKKNVELEKKKANEALKKVELEKSMECEAHKMANSNQRLQECLNVAEKEIKQLKELLDKERGRAALVKKNAELEKKKANDALKKAQLEKNKVIEAQKVANVERKKAEEIRLSWEKLKMETDKVESVLALERSNSEAARKKVESEKQKAIAERKRADLALAKFEEQRQLAEANLKKAMFEKDRADDLNQKLEEVKHRAGKSEEFRERLPSAKLVDSQAKESNNGRKMELASDLFLDILKNDTQLSQCMGKMLTEKEHNITREKKRADSERKKAKKQKRVAEAHKAVAMEQKHRADQVSRELENYKLRVKELQKELYGLVTYRKYVDSGPLRNSNASSETDNVKLLKKRLELEKMLVKHAKTASKVEAIRNDMLRQELCCLKQECFQMQKRLDCLDKSFINGTQAINQLEKMGNQISTRETLCSNGHHRQLISGIDSGLDPPHRGSTPEMLQSSEINSSLASFSDRPLVGSQERGTFRVTASGKIAEVVSKVKPTMSKLPNKTRIRYNKHSVAKADKSLRSPVKDNADEGRVGSCERKRILDTVESIKNLYSKSEKLHKQVTKKLSLLHGFLNGQKHEPQEENVKEDSCTKLVRPSKRRKTSCDGTTVFPLPQDSGEPKSILDSSVDHSDALMCASPLGSDIIKFDQHFKDGTNIAYGRKQDFDELAIYDHLKLLDLDDDDDENSYRRAIAMPLSPVLPDVEFDGDELIADRSSQEGLPNEKDNLTSTSGLVSSQMKTKEDFVVVRDMDSVLGSDTCFHQVNDLGGQMGTPGLSPSGNEETKTQCEKGFACSTGGPLKYFVVSSDNKDSGSISRIFQTIGSCMPQCSFLHSAEIFLQSSVHALWKAKDLSMKEKVCVFFSLTLNGISEVGTEDPAKVLSDDLVQPLVDLVTPEIWSALSDPALQKMFIEWCDLYELEAVIEDFLLQKKVWFCGDVSADSEAQCSSNINLVLNGNDIMLYQLVASPRLLVAGGSLLASLCSRVDHISFVCEVSCNIITMQYDPVVLLAILHMFAHVCRFKYLTNEQYSVAMTVVKSVVKFLEKRTVSTNSSSSAFGYLSKIWSCSINCPFSIGACSMEDVALLLLENLQKHGHSGSSSQDSFEVLKLLVPTVWSHEETTKEVSGPRKAVPYGSTNYENACDYIDCLSLVEMLASVMSWDWTSDHIIGPICEYLESHLMEGFSVVIIVLLGQLGRLGVCESGYEDSGVKKLRGWLSAVICQSTLMKLSFYGQFAIIDAFFGITPIKFTEIIDDKVDTPAVTNQSIIPSSIRAWFSQLSPEQQSHFKCHQAASEGQS